jgi:hypothetical protein
MWDAVFGRVGLKDPFATSSAIARVTALAAVLVEGAFGKEQGGGNCVNGCGAPFIIKARTWLI